MSKPQDAENAKTTEKPEEAEKPAPTLDEVKRHITQLDQILARVRSAEAVKKKDLKVFKEQLPKGRLNHLDSGTMASRNWST